MDAASIESRLLELIADCRGWAIPQADLDDMVALTRAGEPGIALENLCEQLFEYDVAIPTAIAERIRSLGEAMSLREAYWKRLSS